MGNIAAGAALVAALERRYGAVSIPVPLGAETIALLGPPRADELISEEDFARDERLPYWAELWPSAVVLAGEVAAERGAGRTLLELGCGLGLVAVAAMRAGYRVTASDYYEEALTFTRANAWRALGREPATCLLDWRAVPGDLDRYDRVVAADVLYERPHAALVAGVLRRALRVGGEATVADPGRIARPAFVEECAARGLAVIDERRHPCTVGNLRHEISVLAIRRR